ncbi:MAG: hypothetical protein H0X04_02665 [Chthoniobacterales bacterium]|nr:hypothetical protein [Chthoniobacterales bacterium]
MTDDPLYRSEAAWADTLRQFADDPDVEGYARGYRKGMALSTAGDRLSESTQREIEALRSHGESATLDGYEDGLLWHDLTRHAGIVRLMVRRSGLSSRRWAEQAMVRDERTVRRWLAGRAIPAAVVRELRRRLME